MSVLGYELDMQGTDPDSVQITTWGEIFRPSLCFQYHSAGVLEYDATQCYCFIFLSLIAVVNSVLLISFMNLEKKKRGSCSCNLFRKPKFMILVLALSLQISYFCTYFLSIKVIFHARSYLQIFDEIVKDVLWIYVGTFFCKKASNLLPNSHKWQKGLKLIMIITIVLSIVIVLIYQLLFNKLNAHNNLQICKTSLYIVLGIIAIAIAFIFTIIGIKITITLNRYAKSQRWRECNDVLQQKFQQSQRKLWTVIGTILFSVLYQFSYGIFLQKCTDDQCRVAGVTHDIDSVITVISRFISLYLWLYPILYVMYPIANLQKSQKNNHQTAMHKNSVNNSSTDTGRFYMSAKKLNQQAMENSSGMFLEDQQESLVSATETDEQTDDDNDPNHKDSSMYTNTNYMNYYAADWQAIRMKNTNSMHRRRQNGYAEHGQTSDHNLINKSSTNMQDRLQGDHDYDDDDNQQQFGPTRRDVNIFESGQQHSQTSLQFSDQQHRMSDPYEDADKYSDDLNHKKPMLLDSKSSYSERDLQQSGDDRMGGNMVASSSNNKSSSQYYYYNNWKSST